MVTSETLKRYSLFAGLSAAEREVLAGLTTEVLLPPGSALFREGGPADALYVLVDGQVALYHNVRSEDGSTLRAAEAMNLLMEAGDSVPLLEGQSDVFEEYPVGQADVDEIVGISALVPPHRLTATARAKTSARLLRIDAVGLRRACQTDQQLANSLLAATARTALKRLQATRQALVMRR